MAARKDFWRRHAGLSMLVATIAWLGVAITLWPVGTGMAQSPTASGTISGRVRADQGEVRAFRVSVKDTLHKITYTVFTRKGQYQIFNLLPSTYDLQVVEEAYDSPVQNVELRSGETKTVDLSLKMKPDPVVPDVPGGKARPGAELVDWDTLYPPSPARDIMERRCFSCHSFVGFHRRGGKTEAQWRSAIERMFDNQAWNRQLGIEGAPLLDAQLPPQDKEAIAKYLATLFPLNHKPRDLKLDPLVRDEEALAEAIYVRYELPPVAASDFSNGKPAPGFHDAYPARSPEMVGLVWLSGTPNGTIWSVDVRNPLTTPESRTKQFRIPHPENINVRPHGITEFKGIVYTSNLVKGTVTEFNTKTGEFRHYEPPSLLSGGLTVEADSKGNVWWSNNMGRSRVNKLDAVTKTVTEYDPVPGSQWYGLTVDTQDRVWPSAYGAVTPAVPMYDPKTDTWKRFPTTHANRRPTVDSKGIVWTAQYFGNSIGRIDPNSGRVTEHKLPLRYGNPYEVFADREDNIWAENQNYNSLVKYDPRTAKFTYVPFPILRGHTPKMNPDSKGDPWFDMGSQLTVFRAKGNVRVRSTATR